MFGSSQDQLAAGGKSSAGCRPTAAALHCHSQAASRASCASLHTGVCHADKFSLMLSSDITQKERKAFKGVCVCHPLLARPCLGSKGEHRSPAGCNGGAIGVKIISSLQALLLQIRAAGAVHAATSACGGGRAAAPGMTETGYWVLERRQRGSQAITVCMCRPELLAMAWCRENMMSRLTEGLDRDFLLCGAGGSLWRHTGCCPLPRGMHPDCTL